MAAAAPSQLPPGVAPNSMEHTLWQWTQYSLQNHLHENAIFLAERLCAEVATEWAKHLLATCYYQSGAANRAAAVLQGSTTPQNRYLLALCHVKLGKLAEAQTVLLGSAAPDSEGVAQVPNSAAGLYLMGVICLKSQQRARAIKYLNRCLAINPFMWTASEALCQLGAALPEALLPTAPPPSAGGGGGAATGSGPQTPNFGWNETPVAAAGSAAGSSVPTSACPPPPAFGTTPCAATPAAPSTAGGCTPMRAPQLFTPADVGAASSTVPGSAACAAPEQASLSKAVSTPQLATPAGAGGGGANTCSSLPSPTHVPRRRAAPGAPPPVSTGGPAADEPDSGRPDSARSRGGRPAPGRGRVAPASSAVPVRRSSRLSTGTGAPGTDARGEMPPPPGRAGGAAGGGGGEGGEQGAARALWLLRQLSNGYRLLCQYKCQEAVLAFQALPHCQYNTGWVLNQVGRAHFEMVQYTEALRAFEQAQAVEPHRLCGMELHSTILWHLKREVPLCYLAKRAVDFDRVSAYTCCVVGNCFSLQKEHDTALKFFQRAIQLQPDLAYAYTLSGHEYSSNDDFEKAMTHYRSAIRIDERHYNAWYGLGNIYFRQEKYDFAEHHLRKALAINPCSSPLYCYLGMALHANLKTLQALEMLSNAIAIDPKNPLARFQKAQVLIAMEQHDAALVELRTLVEVAPKEGSVYFVLGKVYKKLGQPSQAMVNLTRALDLSPKDAQQIKAAILNLEREDNADEAEEY